MPKALQSSRDAMAELVAIFLPCVQLQPRARHAVRMGSWLWSREPLMSQPLQSLAQTVYTLQDGRMDGVTRQGWGCFPAQSCLVGAAGLLPGNRGQAPGKVHSGTAPPSVGAALVTA